MLPDRIHLIDRDARLVAAWKEVFREHPEVFPERPDFFEVEADAMVSPANSFGIMDGGLDAAIAGTLGRLLEERVRQMTASRHHGELHVGMAEIVETGDARRPFLICAPTMRTPEDVRSGRGQRRGREEHEAQSERSDHARSGVADCEIPRRGEAAADDAGARTGGTQRGVGSRFRGVISSPRKSYARTMRNAPARAWTSRSIRR